jgi:hypothetical protein
MKLARVADPRFHSALDKLANQELPGRVAFRLKGAVKTVREEFAKYEEVRNNALKKYGKKDEAGNLVLGSNQSVEFEGENLQAFAKEIGELANEEVSIPTIKLADLGDKVNLTMADAEMLDGFIVED